MICYVLRTVYNNVLDNIFPFREDVSNTVCGFDLFLPLDTQFLLCQIDHTLAILFAYFKVLTIAAPVLE